MENTFTITTKTKNKMRNKIKTIDIQAKEYFDKKNANSYFSAQITTDFATKKQKDFKLPFQYGYGDHYQCKAIEFLASKGLIEKTNNNFEYAPWRLKERTGIIIRCSKIENCKQSEVKEFGL